MSRKYQSRAKRFDEAQSIVSDAKSTFEELRDGLPENLQNGSKADALDSAISDLEDIISACETVESTTPEFPGMYG